MDWKGSFVGASFLVDFPSMGGDGPFKNKGWLVEMERGGEKGSGRDGALGVESPFNKGQELFFFLPPFSFILRTRRETGQK